MQGSQYLENYVLYVGWIDDVDASFDDVNISVDDVITFVEYAIVCIVVVNAPVLVLMV